MQHILYISFLIHSSVTMVCMRVLFGCFLIGRLYLIVCGFGDDHKTNTTRRHMFKKDRIAS